MDARSITFLPYFISIIYFKSFSSFCYSLYFLYFSSLNFFLCRLYFVSVVEFLNIMNYIWTWYKGLWYEKKISLQVTTFSPLVFVSSIHQYTSSIESCCKHMRNIHYNIKLGDFGLLEWLGKSLKRLHLSFKFINSSNIW